MIKNFYLAAATVDHNEKPDNTTLKLVDLSDGMLDNITKSWNSQYDEFMDEIREIPYTPNYTIESNSLQCFFICPYDLPDWLDIWNTGNAMHIQEEFNIDNNTIKCFVGITQDDTGEEILLFQNFTRSKLITPDRFLFRLRDQYTGVDTENCLMLDYKLTSVYFPKNKKLLFRSYLYTNSFLPLHKHYQEASETDIIDMLSRRIFYCPDKYAIANNCSKTIRRYFSRLKNSDILNIITSNDVGSIRNAGIEYNIAVDVKDGQIIFPNQDEEIEKLLKLLNQDVFKTSITGEIGTTNSWRQADW